jgi:hypothetical protein
VEAVDDDVAVLAVTSASSCMRSSTVYSEDFFLLTRTATVTSS